jgi:hypothetical protein
MFVPCSKRSSGAVKIIEREDHRPVAVMKQPEPVGRKISECIAIAKAHEEIIGYALYLTKISPEMFRKASTPIGNPSATFGISGTFPD